VALATIVFAPFASSQQSPGDRNLLPNASFEDVEQGLPSAWTWSLSRDAQAKCALDATVARSGSHSVRISNRSAQAPHVYGRLSTNVRVTPGRTYTLSCYVKSADPGVAWIGTGRDWQFRFPFPKAPDWTRVTGAFVADTEEEPVMVVSESPTEGFWVDDLQLEPGSRATPYVFDEPVTPGQARLRFFQGDAVSLAPNLVGNSSFEALEGGLPKGWTFDRRNTDAAMAADETVAHSGKRCLKLTNGTGFGPHVYGMLSYLGGVSVEPDTTYTLSCYVRSENPGIAWIGGGPGWLVRLQFPATGGDWRRVSRTIHTGPEERTWTLLVISESPTPGSWIDDVKLERGDEATPYLPEEGADSERVIVDLPGTIAADKMLTLGGWIVSPQAVANARVRAELTDAQGVAHARQEWQGELAAGVAYADFRYGPRAQDPEACTLTLSVLSGDQVLATGRAAFALYTAGRERLRLAATREATKRVRALYDRTRAQGNDCAYQLATLTVAENFCDFVGEDLDHKQVLRAREQMDRIDEMLARAENELGAIADGKVNDRLVPRYVTSPIRIDGSAFIATVQWPDGRREQRPVFFTGYGHFNAVRRDLEKLPAYGLNLIQVEFGPNSTIPSETQESTAPIEDFERLLDRAEKSSVSVNLLLSPHYFPQWAYEKWPSVGGVDVGFARFSVDAPEARAVIERHLRLTASRLKGRPGLHSYCLSNEPIYLNAQNDPCNKQKWIAYLKTKYADLARLNEAHRAQYASFETVPIPAASPPQATPLFYDWCRFNNGRFAEWHKWMADVIHSVDPSIPVHAKIMNTVFNRDCVAWGIDPELFGDLSQIDGNDCTKWYNHNGDTWASGWQGENMFFDLLRSCRAQPIFNSENHVILDRDLADIPAVHLRNVIWQSAVHGEGASTMWVWERTFDDRSDFAGSIMHRPACAEAHGRTALDLMRLAPEVTGIEQAPARVALVYSIASLVYNPAYQGLLDRVYRALNFTGEKIDFITERRLAAGGASQYDAIFAPGVTHLPLDALQALQRCGKPIVTAGDGCLARDDLDREARVGPLTAVQLPNVAEASLRDAIIKLLADRGWRRPVVVLDADSGKEAWGVEWLSAKSGPALLVNLVNYTPKPVKVRLEGPKGPATDLIVPAGPQTRIATSPAGGALTLQPLEPVLLRFAAP
jgi:hypothetical protein